jgi:SH3-like domain-containing protein
MKIACKQLVFLLLALFVSGAPELAQGKSNSIQHNGSGLPLPRFVSLRANEVNMRTGPGVQYPIEWVYLRQNLPMEIVAEFDTWRKVRDWQGTQSWVHKSMLAGRRTLVVTGAERTLRARADFRSAAIAKIEPGVVGHLIFCPVKSSWCRVKVAGHEGWLRRVEIWGMYRNEMVE